MGKECPASEDEQRAEQAAGVFHMLHRVAEKRRVVRRRQRALSSLLVVLVGVGLGAMLHALLAGPVHIVVERVAPAVGDGACDVFVQVDCSEHCPASATVAVWRSGAQDTDLGGRLVLNAPDGDAALRLRLAPGAYSARVDAGAALCWQAEQLDFVVKESCPLAIVRFRQHGVRLQAQLPDWLAAAGVVLDVPSHPGQQLTVGTDEHAACLSSGNYVLAPQGAWQFEQPTYAWSSADPQPLQLRPIGVRATGQVFFHNNSEDEAATNWRVLVEDVASGQLIDSVVPELRGDGTADYAFWLPLNGAVRLSVQSQCDQLIVRSLQPGGGVLLPDDDDRRRPVAVPALYVVLQSTAEKQTQAEEQRGFDLLSFVRLAAVFVVLAIYCHLPERASVFWSLALKSSLPPLIIASSATVAHLVLPYYVFSLAVGTGYLAVIAVLNRHSSVALISATACAAATFLVYIESVSLLAMLVLSALTAFAMTKLTTSNNQMYNGLNF